MLYIRENIFSKIINDESIERFFIIYTCNDCNIEEEMTRDFLLSDFFLDIVSVTIKERDNKYVLIAQSFKDCSKCH